MKNLKASILFILIPIFLLNCQSNDFVNTGNIGNNDINRPRITNPNILDDTSNQNPVKIKENKNNQQNDDPYKIKIGVFLPMTVESDIVKETSAQMYFAIEMAMFEINNPNIELVLYDTKANNKVAEEMANKAIEDGVDFILGPIYSSNVNIVGNIVKEKGINLIAFSSDRRNLKDGTYLFSFPDELEVERVIDYAILNGLNRFALLIPKSKIGDHLLDVTGEALYIRGGRLIATERYGNDQNDMAEAVKNLARNIKSKKSSEEIFDGNAEGNRNRFNYSIDAILIPEDSEIIKSLIVHLPYNDLHPNRIKFLGLSGWGNDILRNNSNLYGSWFASIEPEIAVNFNNDFLDNYGAKPLTNAILAYDAMLIVGKLSYLPANNRFGKENLIDPIGFFGASGLFRFTDDGWVERGLAVMENENGRLKIIDEAPTSFQPSF